MAEQREEDFRTLLAFRLQLRQFLRRSEAAVRRAGLTPAQHELLLAIRGHGDRRGPTVGELARYLALRPHSAVGLLDRAEAAGLVTRTRTDADGRVVRVTLTRKAIDRLNRLVPPHPEQLRRLSVTLARLTKEIDEIAHEVEAPPLAARRPRSTSARRRSRDAAL
ncbi:MAG: MarR family transcriptional regulator [Acidothermus sp.]|nr:MarR family transcriptional regulator [Acidothermus sp.]